MKISASSEPIEKNERPDDDAPIASSHRFVAKGMAGTIGLFAFHIYKNYDAAQATTSVFGVRLQLGENDSGELQGNTNEDAEQEDDDD